MQGLQEAAKRTAEEHQRLQRAAETAAEQLRDLTAVSAADADKVAALQATLLYQERKYQVLAHLESVCACPWLCVPAVLHGCCST